MPDLVALRAANADRCTHAELTRGPEFLAGRAASLRAGGRAALSRHGRGKGGEREARQSCAFDKK